jgi:hypothetical protein
MTPEQVRSAITAWLAAIHQHGGIPTDGSAPTPIARQAGVEAGIEAVKQTIEVYQ